MSFPRRAAFVSIAAFVAALTAAPRAFAQDLERPEGWTVRFDQPGASEDQLEMFVAMPPGWHVTSGPAGVYWGPGMEASGEYRLEMEVYLFDPQGRRESFGVFFGGRDMDGEGIDYSYFLIRDGGEFIVKRWAQGEAPTVVPWTPNPAVVGWSTKGDDATARNVLVVEAGAETVRFLVNDTEVVTLPREELGADGVFGMRVNHGLNLHVSRLEATSAGDAGLR